MKKLLLTIVAVCIGLSLHAQYNKEVVKEILLKTDTTYIGQKIKYPVCTTADIKISKVTIPAGASTGWHKHDTHVFAYVQQGNLTIELEGGKSIDFHQNSTIAEVINTMHNGVNNGKEDVVLIVFQMEGH